MPDRFAESGQRGDVALDETAHARRANDGPFAGLGAPQSKPVVAQSKLIVDYHDGGSGAMPDRDDGSRRLEDTLGETKRAPRPQGQGAMPDRTDGSGRVEDTLGETKIAPRPQAQGAKFLHPGLMDQAPEKQSSARSALPAEQSSARSAIPSEQSSARSAIPPERGRGSDDLEKTVQAVRPPQATQWAWPAWTLNSSDPCIQVYVDDEESGVSKWVDAVPQSRVVNANGVDAYLSVQYNWDGESYDEDFGPEKVRRRGETRTVKEMVANAPASLAAPATASSTGAATATTSSRAASTPQDLGDRMRAPRPQDDLDQTTRAVRPQASSSQQGTTPHIAAVPAQQKSAGSAAVPPWHSTAANPVPDRAALMAHLQKMESDSSVTRGTGRPSALDPVELQRRLREAEQKELEG